MKLAADNYDGVSDIKGAVAAVHFIVTNAAKYDVDDRSLTQEIQQLGLPKENTDAIVKQYREHKDNLRAKFAEQSYRVSRLLHTDWRVDHIISSSAGEEGHTGALVHLKMQVDTAPEQNTSEPLHAGEDRDSGGGSAVQSNGDRVKDVAFEVSAERLDVLVYELSQAQKLLESVES